MVVWIGTTAIVGLVLLVQGFSQPWRGIADAGVVVGLTWGLLSFVLLVWKTFASGTFFRSPEVT